MSIPSLLPPTGAEYALSAKPRWAVTAWVDHNNVFVELPVRDQAPFIMKFHKTPEGLREALQKMMDYHVAEAGPPVYQVPPRIAPNEPVLITNRKAMVRSILRQRGIIK